MVRLNAAEKFITVFLVGLLLPDLARCVLEAIGSLLVVLARIG